MALVDFKHAKLLQDLMKSGATIEDLARAWASMDGRSIRFDGGKNKSELEDPDGVYHGYMCETEEVIARATKYALDRKK